MLNPIKSVLFDLDGTLMDSFSVTLEGFQRGLESGGHRRLDPKELVALFGPAERSIFATLLGEAKADHAFSIFRNYTQSALSEIPIHKGILELIAELKNRNLKVGIFTGRGRTTTDFILKHHGITNQFEVIITNDDVPHPKPAPDGILKALHFFGLKPAEGVYVGDTVIDIQASKRAGCKSIGAHWDWFAKSTGIEPIGADLHCAHPSECLKILDF